MPDGKLILGKPVVTVSSMPLPTGAATEATLLLVKTAVELIDNFISANRGLVTEDNSASILAKLDDVLTQLQSSSAVYQGTKAVPTGTSEAIASSQSCYSVTVKALSTNTAAVYVGASGCTAANGLELLPGESVSLDVNNVSLVYCISGVISQVIRWIAI